MKLVIGFVFFANQEVTGQKTTRNLCQVFIFYEKAQIQAILNVFSELKFQNDNLTLL